MDILVSLGGPVVHSWIRALLDRAAVDVVAKERHLAGTKFSIVAYPQILAAFTNNLACASCAWRSRL